MKYFLIKIKGNLEQKWFGGEVGAKEKGYGLHDQLKRANITHEITLEEYFIPLTKRKKTQLDLLNGNIKPNNVETLHEYKAEGTI